MKTQQKSTRRQNWEESNSQSIIYTLETYCLNQLNQQIQEFGHDLLDSIQQTASNEFVTIPINGKTSKSKCAYAFDKQDTFFFVVTFKAYSHGEIKRSFNTSETLESLWHDFKNNKSDLPVPALKNNPQPIVKPSNPDKVANDQINAQNALNSDLALFNSLPSIGISDYLEIKGLLELKSKCLRYGEGFIMLAITNILTNKTVGFQKIYDNGDKRFTKGLTKHNSAIVIDGDSSVIAICEGFATGATINKAMGCLVYCALDAGNIESVANSVKQLYSEQIKEKTVSIVIYADNDSRKPTDKNKENTGIIKAYNAALKNRFDLTYPLIGDYSFEDLLFPNEQIEKVDFNDLLVRFDIETVASQIEENRFKPKVRLSIETKQVEIEKPIETTAPKRQLIKGCDLMKKEFKPVDFIVDSLIPESSLNLLVAPPKVGKSWLAMDLALGVALGGKALGRLECTKQNVLYLSLDSSNEHKLQARLKILEESHSTTQRIEIPDNLCFLTEFSQGKEAITELLELIKENNFKFVIIDILHNLKDASNTKNNSVYDSDYNFVRSFRTITEQTGCAILFVHHTNKGKHDDALNQISGSNGLSGSVDNTFILSRARASDEGEIIGIGRDLFNDDPIPLKWEKENCIWKILDNKSEPLTALQQTVLNAVTINIKTVKAIAQYAEKSEAQISNMLSLLIQRGYIKRVHRGEYECTQKPSN